jgi:hypothetical protein
MKASASLLTSILVTVSALGVAEAGPRDAHASAAALLSPPRDTAQLIGGREYPSVPTTGVIDAHASAAALLSGLRSSGVATISTSTAADWSASSPRVDAHARAAALLRGSMVR